MLRPNSFPKDYFLVFITFVFFHFFDIPMLLLLSFNSVLPNKIYILNPVPLVILVFSLILVCVYILNFGPLLCLSLFCTSLILFLSLSLFSLHMPFVLIFLFFVGVFCYLRYSSSSPCAPCYHYTTYCCACSYYCVLAFFVLSVAFLVVPLNVLFLCSCCCT
jgi:hypothetical protein